MHQIPVMANANEIRYFLSEDAVHHQFVTTLVREIYKINHCGHLDATIDQFKTLSFLGKLHADMLAKNEADICRVRLMSQLCEVSTAILGKQQQSVASVSPSNGELKEIAEF